MKKRKLSSKGTFHNFPPMMIINLQGNLLIIQHTVLNLMCIHFAKEMPATETGLIHYLSGDLFPGIGMKTAETIVETLGKDAIKKILDDSTVLDTIPRLSDREKRDASLRT